ncbi:hypothetical protein ACFL08_00855 [Patescibacteria group bacterium]
MGRRNSSIPKRKPRARVIRTDHLSEEVLCIAGKLGEVLAKSSNCAYRNLNDSTALNLSLKTILDMVHLHEYRVEILQSASVSERFIKNQTQGEVR